jgi:hypothetical protein
MFDVTAIALIPIGIVSCLITAKLRHIAANPVWSRLGMWSVLCFSVWAVLLTIKDHNSGSLAGNWPTILDPSPLLLSAGAVSLVGAASCLLNWKLPFSKLNSDRIFILLASSILLSALAYRIFAVGSVTHTSQKVTHLDAVLYSVSQAVHGKFLLADLPAQYGLYGEFIAPLIRLLGPSVLTFTVVMAILQGIADVALLYVIFRNVRSIVLRLMACCTLLLFAGYTWIAPIDTYFQYYPVRYFFAAISVALFDYHAQNRVNRGAYMTAALLGVCAALAVPFNLDSGIPVLGSCIAGLLYLFATARDSERRKTLAALAIFFITAALTAILFVALSYVQGKSPQWASILKFPKYFYLGGFNMLPMPHGPHLWMLVMLEYVLCVFATIFSGFERRTMRLDATLFFVSVLGIGLFSYYQGRSHIIVLLLAIWPSVVLAFLLADRTLRIVHSGYLPPIFRYAAIPTLVLGTFGVAEFAAKMPVLIKTAAENWQLSEHAPSTDVLRNIAFIRQSGPDERSMVIVAAHQAVYYLETGTASAVGGPGIAETLNRQDRAKSVAGVFSQHVRDIFYEPDARYIHPDYSVLLRSPAYEVVGRSPDGMLHLRIVTH